MIEPNNIYAMDCIEGMREMEAESVDLIATDPPYGISMMGKQWDKAVPSTEIWKECHRVLKPGAFAFVMSIPRMDCLAEMSRRLEKAGFEVGFTPIFWTYMTGWPKGQNISLAIDRRACMEQLKKDIGRKPTKEEWEESWKNYREVIGTKYSGLGTGETYAFTDENVGGEVPITVPRTSDAQSLDGAYGGFQPKPAVESILVCMKPLSKSGYVEQALTNRKGVTWLDDVRIPFADDDDKREAEKLGESFEGTSYDTGRYNINVDESFTRDRYVPSEEGRLPANLIVSDEVLNNGKVKDSFSRYFDLDAWYARLVERLPKDVQQTFPFMIVPKPSKTEKDAGITSPGEGRAALGIALQCTKCGITQRHAWEPENVGKCDHEWEEPVSLNYHTTVKPVKLMSYLIVLGSRRDDLVLDPFVGSGSTAVAAKRLGRRYIGFDIDEGYVQIANARLDYKAPKLTPLENRERSVNVVDALWR